MEQIYNIISTWSGAIVSAFEQHLFISAVVTLAAVAVFFYLEKRQKSTLTHVVLLLIAWLIVVPILGTILDGVDWLLSVVGKIVGLLVATYKHFESQPLWVLGYLITAITLYLIWPKLQRNYIPTIRVVVAVVFFLGLTFLTVPVISQFTEDESPNKELQPTAESAG